MEDALHAGGAFHGSVEDGFQPLLQLVCGVALEVFAQVRALVEDFELDHGPGTVRSDVDHSNVDRLPRIHRQHPAEATAQYEPLGLLNSEYGPGLTVI
jgi:hypothetical protein